MKQQYTLNSGKGVLPTKGCQLEKLTCHWRTKTRDLRVEIVQCRPSGEDLAVHSLGAIIVLFGTSHYHIKALGKCITPLQTLQSGTTIPMFSDDN